MSRIEKTVFMSYRRTNAPWALALFQNLTHHGYDVFFDFSGIASGDFESIILENIKARAHFLVLLTPSALERCQEPGDWLRREIETAVEIQRNIVPLMLEGFDFDTPAIAHQLTGKLAALRKYNALRVPTDYFMEAMDRLRQKYLNVSLEAVLQPASLSVQRTTRDQQDAADRAPSVRKDELTAQEWFERGFDAAGLDEKIRFYSQAILLKPSYADAFMNRGNARNDKGDFDGALEDYSEAINLRPDQADGFIKRAKVRHEGGDLSGALEDLTNAMRLDPDNYIALYSRGAVLEETGNLPAAVEDYNEVIRVKPDHAEAFFNRGRVHETKGDVQNAMQDYNEAVRLMPDYATAFCRRGILKKLSGDLEGALQDYSEALRFRPDYADALYNRSIALKDKGDLEGALQDYNQAIRIVAKQTGDRRKILRGIVQAAGS